MRGRFCLPSGFVSTCVFNAKPRGNPPHKGLSTHPTVRAVGLSLSPGAWVIFTQEKHHKTPSAAGERSTSVIPTFPRTFQGCASLPSTLEREPGDLLRADTFYMIKESQNAAQCSHSVCLDHRESQVISLNVQSTE